MPHFSNALKARLAARLAASGFWFHLRTLAYLPIAVATGLAPGHATAGDWGLTVAYNNPAGANVGANLIYLGQIFAFEVGVGGVGGGTDDDNGNGDDDSARGGLWGDVDAKIMFGKTWRPYIEAGFGMGLGAGIGGSGGFSAGAGSPFVGVGLMYVGSPLLFYVAGDYKISSKQPFPVVGVGVKF